VTDVFEAVNCTVVVTGVFSSCNGSWNRFSHGAEVWFIPCRCPDTISSSLNREKIRYDIPANYEQLYRIGEVENF
jgi:hypothetical protein